VVTSGRDSQEGKEPGLPSTADNMGSLRDWVGELRRRRVFRALVAYGIAAFAVLQVVEPIMHGAHWPEIALSYVVAGLGAGFPIVIALAWIFDVRGGRIQRTPPVSAGGPRGTRVALLLVAIGIAAAAPGLLYYFVFRPIDGRLFTRGTGSAEHTSIAVLPFVNMSSDKENEYFSDGITEELTSALANIDGLRVASRTAAFAFKGKNIGIKQIGDELNVATVLEGSIRRDGNYVRVVAQLIGAPDGYHLWSKTYDREVKNVFQLEDELARSIAQALRPKLVTSASTSLVKASTANADAHDLYLRGRFLWQKRTPESLTNAAAHFQQAVELDPTYALAYLGLADARLLLIEYGSAPSRDMLPKAKEAVRKALELDGSLAEAHAALGNVSIFEFEWATAERELQRAIELKPDDASAHHRYALVLVMEGRCKEGQAQAEKGSQLDPTSLVISTFVTVTLYCARDYTHAIEQAKKTLELDPRFALARSYLGLAYIGQGRYTEAIQELEKLEATNRYVGDLGYAYGIGGQRDKALRLLSDLDGRSRTEYVTPTVRALIYLGLGQKEQALSWLEKAVAERDWRLRQLKFDRRWDPLRSEPRFARILKQVNLD
jgi:TolB-like protein/tetratricopeptide (TPR) repeat protein